MPAPSWHLASSQTPFPGSISWSLYQLLSISKSTSVKQKVVCFNTSVGAHILSPESKNRLCRGSLGPLIVDIGSDVAIACH